MKDETKDENGRAIGYGCLWMILTCMAIFAASVAAPTFSQLPRHVQDKFHNEIDFEVIRRAIMHGVVLCSLLLISGSFMAWLIQKRTTNKLRREKGQNQASHATSEPSKSTGSSANEG
ncbi:MAG: hypothetical protein NTV49_01535 [Kiritimatiellaeota bacterium]|nr:hypothetical protein [Kiritimatiellota bacterium]